MSKLVFVGGGGQVYALEKETGTVRWEISLKGRRGWFVMGSDFVSLLEGPDDLYVVSYGIVFQIDKDTGRIKWKTEIRDLKNEIATLTTETATAASAAGLATAAGAEFDSRPGGGHGGNGNGG